jgi:hypothetical protein
MISFRERGSGLTHRPAPAAARLWPQAPRAG